MTKINLEIAKKLIEGAEKEAKKSRCQYGDFNC